MPSVVESAILSRLKSAVCLQFIAHLASARSLVSMGWLSRQLERLHASEQCWMIVQLLLINTDSCIMMALRRPIVQ
jgi:hypothetical protein